MLRLPTVLLLCLALLSLPASGLTLSTEERDWLAAHPEISLGIDENWPPFEFRDEQKHYHGLTADYISLIEKRLGVDIKPVEARDWSAVLGMARTGEVQLLSAVMATPERHRYLTFTAPYLDFPIVILVRKDGPQPSSIDDLPGLTVGVVKDYAPHEILKNQHPELNLHPLPSTFAALQALATGEVDVMIGDLASSTWSMRQSKISGLRINGQTPYRYQLSMAAPRDQPILVGILDRLLAELTPQEVTGLQERWVGMDTSYAKAWDNKLLFGLPVLLLLAGAVLALYLGNSRLRASLKRSQDLQHGLQLSEQHFRDLVETLDVVTWEMLPAEERFTYVSPHAEELFGYPLEDWLKPGFWQSLLPATDKQQSLAPLSARRGRPFHLRLLSADGRTLWVRCIATQGEDGPRQVLRGLLIDMSESRQAEQALRQSEQKFASVFNNCPDIMVITRQADGRIIAINQAFEQQIGFAANEVLGKTPTEIGLWGIDGIGADLIARVQAAPQHNLELPFIRRNGERFYGLLSAQMIKFGKTPAIIGIVRDISRLKDAQQKLALSEEKFAKAFRASPDGVLLTRMSDGLLLDVNDGFSRITGYSTAETAGQSTASLNLWVDPASRNWLIQQVRACGSVQAYKALIRNRDGQQHLCEISAQRLSINGVQCMLAIARDVSESTRMEEKLRQAATVFESTAEGVLITDLEQRITAVNKAFTTITGYSEAEVLGLTPRVLASGQHDSAFFVGMWHSLASEGHWQGEICNRRKNGELFPCWLTINAVRDSSDEIRTFVCVFADISALKQTQARLDHQVHHDPLTGLPNRLLFEKRLQDALDEAHSDVRHGAVLFIDLDHFKHINDSLGHPVGDLLLKDIARRLLEQVRDIDTVARLGGDEFIILLPGLNHQQDAEQIATKLLAHLQAPFHIEGHEFFARASIGISLYPDDGADVASIVRNADAAMYRSKSRGRNRIEFYSHSLSHEASERVSLKQELRFALERNELQLRYQPKVTLLEHQLVGAEVLICWNHPRYGDVPPERFIPLAEECGLAVSIDEWMLQQCCQQLGRWKMQFAEFGALSITLSSTMLHYPQLTELVARRLNECNLSPASLQLEIAEGLLTNPPDDLQGLLCALKARGLGLAIADFGTGHASLSYLKSLPLDELKIDQSFISNLPDFPYAAATVRAIIALASSMNLKVTAEGVETLEQEAFLAREGCHQLQGPLIRAPLSAEAFAASFLSATAELGATQPPPV
ncbi:PAS domain S-box protein [Pseudomonas sp. N040]|uniref:PAS domain S-box protein n=1 Tax=Pseudomonas sp. N040 TaxID=2785325 RepID=UPI0018A25DF2|nr:PAS domain S-box protein [Pseudomonas sp. N040]MBF7728507.1 PAS domain S-box protein [Pseudomonas sp. N040]MBW7012147.1 PAS domain S-box protein [Pseudomonas sp. N040]